MHRNGPADGPIREKINIVILLKVQESEICICIEMVLMVQKGKHKMNKNGPIDGQGSAKCI